jgi:hypothetical protein
MPTEEEREFTYGSPESIKNRIRQVKELTDECDSSVPYKAWAACREILLSKEITPSEVDEFNTKVRSYTLRFGHNCVCKK